MERHDLPRGGASLAPSVACGHGSGRPPEAALEAFARVEPALAHQGEPTGGRRGEASPRTSAGARCDPPERVAGQATTAGAAGLCQAVGRQVEVTGAWRSRGSKQGAKGAASPRQGEERGREAEQQTGESKA
eukprot:5964501-Lingulodinium_polyedra.AAC.1